MGVLRCDREGCTHIMCVRYDAAFGYICGDCFNELREDLLRSEEPLTAAVIRGFLRKPKEPSWAADRKNEVDDYLSHLWRTI